MKSKTVFSILAVAACVAVHASGLKFDITADHADATYKLGEQAVFTVKVQDASGAPAKSGRVKWTLNNFGAKAIAAKYMGIPFFVSGIPDESHRSRADIRIESRNPDFVLQAMGVRTAAPGVKGYYPSFDITPPHLISGVVTNLGIWSPYDLPRYLAEADIGPYEMVI